MLVLSYEMVRARTMLQHARGQGDAATVIAVETLMQTCFLPDKKKNGLDGKPGNSGNRSAGDAKTAGSDAGGQSVSASATAAAAAAAAAAEQNGAASSKASVPTPPPPSSTDNLSDLPPSPSEPGRSEYVLGDHLSLVLLLLGRDLVLARVDKIFRTAGGQPAGPGEFTLHRSDVHEHTVQCALRFFCCRRHARTRRPFAPRTLLAWRLFFVRSFLSLSVVVA
jgi:hypothetical protein